ncbi:MAG: hypothetical protein AAGE88_18110 [Actinomycetota bacterium]
MSASTSNGTYPEPHAVLDLFARVRDIKDTQISRALEIHRNSVSRKRTGEIRLHERELDVLAVAFAVPVEVFNLTGLEAMRWAVENRPEWFAPRSPNEPTPISAAREAKLADKLSSPAGVVQWNHPHRLDIAA